MCVCLCVCVCVCVCVWHQEQEASLSSADLHGAIGLIRNSVGDSGGSGFIGHSLHEQADAAVGGRGSGGTPTAGIRVHLT